eukprot:jgi/Picre1/35808/NNA_003268.t1
MDEENPGNTLYVNNLYEKITHDDLMQALRCMFQRYGTILDIIARKTYKLRGQAWVVFARPEDAQAAKEQLDGFPFMNKPIRIAFAKTKSDAVARQDGTYDEKKVEERKKMRRDAWEAKVQAALQKEQEAVGGRAPGAKKEQASNPRCTILVENIPKEANEGMLYLCFNVLLGLKKLEWEVGPKQRLPMLNMTMRRVHLQLLLGCKVLN